MEITGTIEHIGVVEVNGTFSKQNMVVLVAGQYPQSINIEFQQGNLQLLEALQVNQEVTVSIDLRGRKWTDKEGVDKWFNTVVGYKVVSNSNF
jgi:hypothetical protein